MYIDAARYDHHGRESIAKVPVWKGTPADPDSTRRRTALSRRVDRQILGACLNGSFPTP